MKCEEECGVHTGKGMSRLGDELEQEEWERNWNPREGVFFTSSLSHVFSISLFFTIDMQNCRRHVENLYIKLLFSGIQGSKILTQLAEISKKTYHFYNVIQKQICNVHVFTHDAVVLPASTSNATHNPLSHRCHCNRGWLNLWLHWSICSWNLSCLSLLCCLWRLSLKN
jgi:hypothetical protein